MHKRLALLAGLVPASAHAHHFMGGALPGTFTEGLLSGLGHPVIGVDHAAFIVAAGFLLALVDRGLWALAALVGGSLVGAGLHLAGFGVPACEELIAASVLIAGGLVAWRKKLPLAWVCAGLALAGALHGYAYAETIFGAQPAPLGAYLLGFSLIQLALGAAAYAAHRRLIAAHAPALASWLGAAAAALGGLFLALGATV
jgi:urease accessory protein